MDGVLVNSENTWEDYEHDFLDKLLGRELTEKIGDTVGVGVGAIYEKALKFGFVMTRQSFQDAYDQMAFKVYDESNLTSGLDKLVKFLTEEKFKLGLVSSSPLNWVHKILPKLSFKSQLEVVISLDKNDALKSKPEPDGYREAMKVLGATPKTTIILEDSNTGIASGLASGAFTIGFTPNLVRGYKQIEADATAENVVEVIEIVKGLTRS